MRILEFKFEDPVESGFDVSPLTLRPHINLFVGLSGSGKSRILNMLMNIGTAVAQGDRYLSGRWLIIFEHNDQRYRWEYKGVSRWSDTRKHLEETLSIVDIETDEQQEIFVRKDSDINFGGVQLPKIGGESLGIYLFREEEDVANAYAGFCKMQRRIFAGDDLARAAQIQGHPYRLLEKLTKLGRRAKVDDVWAEPISLHVKLFVLNKFFPKHFQAIEREFRAVFPNVLALTIGAASKHLNMKAAVDAPIAMIKERGVTNNQQIGDISSGMLKVLLIITDIIISPDGIVYMIDEYENSLGINAINFLPTFLMEYGGDRQFIVTSHHPFLINAIPIKDWFVFRRDGLKINITAGSTLKEKYGRSKQQQFIQLMNDPIYTQSN